MSCSEFRNRLHPWLRGELSDDEATAVRRHVAGCRACASAAENEKAIVDHLRLRYEAPEASGSFEQRVMAAATGKPLNAASRRSVSLPIVGGAVAAALALGIVLGFGLRPEALPERAGAPVESDTFEVQDPYTVRLAFDSAEAMENVTLTVELPAHVEMTSYPGQQQLSWNVNLDKGENILKLPLNVLFPGEGDLVAHLDNGGRTKTFRTRLSQRHVESASEPLL